MTNGIQSTDLKELAGGSILERKGTPIPLFLKLTYVGFCAFGLLYLFRYWAGEVHHATRGPLVVATNKVMPPPGIAWQGSLAAILAVFVIGLLWYAFIHKGDDD